MGRTCRPNAASRIIITTQRPPIVPRHGRERPPRCGLAVLRHVRMTSFPWTWLTSTPGRSGSNVPIQVSIASYPNSTEPREVSPAGATARLSKDRRRSALAPRPDLIRIA